MGINGLTQFLRPIYVKKRVKDLHRTTFGVDAMAWLYRGFYGQKYATNNINERFLSFYYRMLSQLRKYNIKVTDILYALMTSSDFENLLFLFNFSNQNLFKNEKIF